MRKKTTDYSKRLGQKITAARESAKMSQRQLAVAAGISQPYIWQIEIGRTVPSVEKLQQIADALNIDISLLLPKMKKIIRRAS
jgi:transcriptional regulator with XRE-family HTH domain